MPFLFMFFCGLVSGVDAAVPVLSAPSPSHGPAPWSAAGSELGVQSSYYFSETQPFFRPDAAANSSSLVLNLESSRRLGKPGFVAIKLRDEYSPVENWNYLNIHEAYARASLAPGVEFALGRKLETWTEWEESWGQGLFQPRYLENKLRPQAAGLTGAFLHVSGSRAAATFAALPIFLPDFGPHFDVRDNRFASANPWFHPPSSEFQYRGVNSPIHYSVNRPSVESVAVHAGAAAKLEANSGPLAQRLSYAYKPLPQLLSGFPSRGRYNPATDVMAIQINVRTLYHQVFAYDLAVRTGGWRVTASVARDLPAQDRGPVDWTSQQVAPAWVYAASVSRVLEEDGPAAARLTLSALKVQGGDAPDYGDFSGKHTLFERRYQFTEAVALELSKPIRHLFANPLNTGLRVVYDRAQNGALLTLESSLIFQGQWRAAMQVDFLGLLGSRATVEDGFFSAYRANDRVGAGISYVF